MAVGTVDIGTADVACVAVRCCRMSTHVGRGAVVVAVFAIATLGSFQCGEIASPFIGNRRGVGEVLFEQAFDETKVGTGGQGIGWVHGVGPPRIVARATCAEAETRLESDESLLHNDLQSIGASTPRSEYAATVVLMRAAFRNTQFGNGLNSALVLSSRLAIRFKRLLSLLAPHEYSCRATT